MRTKVQAATQFQAGDVLSVDNRGRAKLPNTDNSKKARLLRWVGGGIKNDKLSGYGYDKSPIIGVAIQDSVPSEIDDCHFVEVELAHPFTK